MSEKSWAWRRDVFFGSASLLCLSVIADGAVRFGSVICVTGMGPAAPGSAAAGRISPEKISESVDRSPYTLPPIQTIGLRSPSGPRGQTDKESPR